MTREEIVAPGRRGREAGRRLLRRRRVLARRRRPHRARLPLPRSSKRRSTAGATTVNIPDTVGYATPQHIRPRRSATLQEARAEHRQGGDQRPLPQRPGPGRRQQPGRRRERRRPDRVHDQRHRRAGRQLLAGRSRDGAADARRLLPLHDRHQHAAARARPAGWSRTITGMQVQRNKAIVGRNAFAHEAGIHQDGMLKERAHLRDHAARGRRLSRKTDLVLGKHSGRARAGRPGQGPGLPPRPASSCRPVFDEFKKLADKKKDIYDGDIVALIEQQIHGEPARTSGSSSPFEVASGSGHKPRVKLTLRRGDKEFTEEADRRRRPDRRRVPGDREDHRHQARAASTTRSTAPRSATTPWAK